MGSSTFLNNRARLNPNYLTDKEPCIETSTDTFKSEYAGSGIDAKDHPLNQELRIEKRACLNCESTNFKVIYAQRSIHPMNGDEYFDLEIVCQDCGKFSIFAYADND